MPSVSECVRTALNHRVGYMEKVPAIILLNRIDRVAKDLETEFGNIFGAGALVDQAIDKLSARLEREEFSACEDAMDGSI